MPEPLSTFSFSPSRFPQKTEIQRLRLIAATRAPNTRDTYERTWRGFCRWCDSYGIQPLPATPEAVSAYVAELIGAGRRPATADLHVSAICFFHRRAGMEPPLTLVVRQVLAGARRMAPEPRGKTALTPAHLALMLAAQPDTIRGVRDQAILLLGFATALRAANLAALNIDDLEFRPDGLVMRVRREKNNQAGFPRYIGVFSGEGKLDPIAAVEAWLRRRGPYPGPLFCRLDRGSLHAAPARIGRDLVLRVVKRAAAAAGLEPAQYGAHSLRAGFVTAAAQAGVSPLIIAQTTGHRTLSMVQRYFRPVAVFGQNPLDGVL